MLQYYTGAHTITTYHRTKKLKAMASMTIRSTYAFDPETVEAIRTLAKRWKVSQAEALRRSVRIAVAQVSDEPTPGEVIAHYRNQGAPRDWKQTEAIAERLRADREAEDLRRTDWHD